MRITTYQVVVEFDGWDYSKDRLLLRLSRRNYDGGGYGFGKRDHSWCFKRKSAANALAAKLRRKKWASVSVNHWND